MCLQCLQRTFTEHGTECVYRARVFFLKSTVPLIECIPLPIACAWHAARLYEISVRESGYTAECVHRYGCTHLLCLSLVEKTILLRSEFGLLFDLVAIKYRRTILFRSEYPNETLLRSPGFSEQNKRDPEKRLLHSGNHSHLVGNASRASSQGLCR
eukprot:jgi/Botrbrau1/10575/Bobra.0343s0023.1